MAENEPLVQKFRNRYGEDWEFEYYPDRREGILRGSDIDWEEHAVVEGHAPGVVLNEEELSWLRAVWISATGEVPPQTPRRS
jgi:hypothetical protein